MQHTAYTCYFYAKLPGDYDARWWTEPYMENWSTPKLAIESGKSKAAKGYKIKAEQVKSFGTVKDETCAGKTGAEYLAAVRAIA